MIPKTCEDCGGELKRRRAPCPDKNYAERGVSCGVAHFTLHCPACEEPVKNESVNTGVVINGNDVFIDGEQCYPRRLVEELDEAWAAEAYPRDTDERAAARTRLDRARRALEL